MSLAKVLAEIARERQHQDAKWGEQNHPDGTGPDWQVGGMSSTWLLDAIRHALAGALKPTYRVRFGKGPTVDVGEDGLAAARLHGNVDVQEIPPADATWLLIAAEEAFEAFVETDEAKLRAELVQLAAVAVAWIEAIDRRGPVSTSPETGPLPEGITPEFAEGVRQFLDENDELMRRLAAGPSAESTKDGAE